MQNINQSTSEIYVSVHETDGCAAHIELWHSTATFTLSCGLSGHLFSTVIDFQKKALPWPWGQSQDPAHCDVISKIGFDDSEQSQSSASWVVTSGQGMSFRLQPSFPNQLSAVPSQHSRAPCEDAVIASAFHAPLSLPFRSKKEAGL